MLQSSQAGTPRGLPRFKVIAVLWELDRRAEAGSQAEGLPEIKASGELCPIEEDEDLENNLSNTVKSSDSRGRGEQVRFMRYESDSER